MAKILIVDDRPFNRQFLLTLLGYTGHELLEAADGAAALEAVRAQRPELVISDILMPTMDGFQFAQHVRADPAIAHTRIIFYTATYREPEARALAEACGVRTVLPKPSDPDVILAAVEAELGKASQSQSLDIAGLPADGGNTPPLRRIDEQLTWYTDELRTVEATFNSILDRMSDPITAREEMRALAGRFSDSFFGLRRLASKLTTVIEVMLDVNPERGPAYLLETFVEAGRKILGARLGAVAMFDETTKELMQLVTGGFEGTMYLDATDALSGVPGSLLGRDGVLRAGKDAPWSPDDFPIAHPSPHGFMGAGVAVPGRSQGWIYFTDKLEGEFTDEDERLLATIAAQLAVSYANTTVFDLLQHHAAKLQIEITRREKAESEIRSREDQLAQSRKMEAVGQLTGGIAHDFNNLLTVIKGNAEHLSGNLRDEDLRPQVHLIEEAAERGADLVRRLLAFARKQELKPEIVDLNAQLASFLKLVRRTLAENITLRLVPGEALPPVYADPGSLENALLNLALNARDAMPDGGTITITTATTTLSGAEAPGGEVKPGRFVMVSVADTGRGMGKDVIARAFDPFFTTKEVGKGTGLGLSMVYGFVKQSGGHAEIASEPGQGAVVKLYLPAARGVTATFHAAEAPPPPKAVAPADTTGKTRVLLVEDDRLVREDVTARLTRLGYGVTAVSTAGEAMTALEGAAFDLVLTDIIMPGRMNGVELAREIVSRWPATKVVATSGYTENALEGKAKMPEGVRFLSKPYSTAQLAEIIRVSLGS